MNNVKKFCLPNKLLTIIIMLIVFIILYATILISLLAESDIDEISKNLPMYAIITFVIMLILFGAFYYEVIVKPNKRFKKRLKYFKANNMENYIISDFNRGVKMFNNNVIVGEYCLIGKGEGLIVFYNEIEKFSCFFKTSADEDGNTRVSKELRIVGGGIKYRLCSVDDWSVYEPDYIQLCTFLKLKNPNIIIE